MEQMLFKDVLTTSDWELRWDEDGQCWRWWTLDEGGAWLRCGHCMLENCRDFEDEYQVVALNLPAKAFVLLLTAK